MTRPHTAISASDSLRCSVWRVFGFSPTNGEVLIKALANIRSTPYLINIENKILASQTDIIVVKSTNNAE